MYEEESLPPRIEKAFADIPYPGDDRLVPDPFHWEAGRIAQEFAGQDWKTIPLDVLSSYQEGLTYFNPEAFRYYLPAYLLAVLKRLSAAEAETRAADIPERVEHILTPPKEQGFWLDEFRARMSGLTLEQKMVVRDFLRWTEQSQKEWEQKYLPEDARGDDEEDEIARKAYWENVR